MPRLARMDRRTSVTACSGTDDQRTMLNYEIELAEQHEHLDRDLTYRRQRVVHADQGLLRARERLTAHEAALRAAVETRRVGAMVAAGTVGILGRRRLRRWVQDAEERLALAQHGLNDVQQRCTWTRAEQARVRLWLDPRIAEDTPLGHYRRQLAEAAGRSAEPPAGIRRYATFDAFITERPARVSHYTEAGVPILEGADFGCYWRRDGDDDHTVATRRAGRWRLSRNGYSGEIYALGPGPDHPVWVLDTGLGDEEALATIVTPLLERMVERNSLLLVVTTLAETAPSLPSTEEAVCSHDCR